MKFLDRSEDLERRCFRGSMKWVSTGCTTSHLSRESSQPEPRAALTAGLPTPSHQRLTVQLARPTPRPTRCNYRPRLPRRRATTPSHQRLTVQLVRPTPRPTRCNYRPRLPRRRATYWPDPRPAPQDVTIDPGCPDGGPPHHHTSVWLYNWPDPRPAPQDVTIDPGCPDGGLPTPSHQHLTVQLARPTARPTRCNYRPRLPRWRATYWPDPRPAPQDVNVQWLIPEPALWGQPYSSTAPSYRNSCTHGTSPTVIIHTELSIQNHP